MAVWQRAMPPGPDARVKITTEYAKHVARDVLAEGRRHGWDVDAARGAGGQVKSRLNVPALADIERIA